MSLKIILQFLHLPRTNKMTTATVAPATILICIESSYTGMNRKFQRSSVKYSPSSHTWTNTLMRLPINNVTVSPIAI